MDHQFNAIFATSARNSMSKIFLNEQCPCMPYIDIGYWCSKCSEEPMPCPRLSSSFETCCWSGDSYEKMMAYIELEIWGQDMNVYSITAGCGIYAVFGMSKFGSEQKIDKIEGDYCLSGEDGYIITSCFPHGESFYGVFTKSTPAGCPKNKEQKYLILKKMCQVLSEIEYGIKRNFIVTALSYSRKSGAYLLGLSKSPNEQYFTWDDSSCKPGFTPTLIFQDPHTKQVLYVKTQDKDLDACDYIIRSNYKISSYHHISSDNRNYQVFPCQPSTLRVACERMFALVFPSIWRLMRNVLNYMLYTNFVKFLREIIDDSIFYIITHIFAEFLRKIIDVFIAIF